jgi:hypothetical protein
MQALWLLMRLDYEKGITQIQILGDWNQFVYKLKQSFIRLGDEKDEIIWSKNISIGRCNAQLGYKASFGEVGEGE